MELVPISEVFEIEYGNSLELNRLEVSELDSAINFVSRTSKNNGVSARVRKLENERIFDAGLITVSVGGSVLETFLQPSHFYSGYHVMVLKPKTCMTDTEKLFYCTCIRKNKYRYNYGRQANRTLKSIKVPAQVPDWVNKIEVNNAKNLSDSIIYEKVPLLTKDWQWIRYDELFKIERGRGPRVKEIEEFGITPFITSTDKNNGLTGWTNDLPIHNGNVISVNRNGSVAEAFYQPIPFCSTEDVHIFNPKFDLNPFIALFLISLIRKEKYRYSYGRKWGIGRMNETLIKLPSTSNGTPDWEFMENYIKSLPFSKGLA